MYNVKVKDDKYNFDLFGIAEVNVNWSNIPDDDELVDQSLLSWEHCQYTQKLDQGKSHILY
jgi:hypothetical protein